MPKSFFPNSEQIKNDYRIAVESRQISLIGRKEVLTGKAKFGIFGDGKEVPQLAMAHAFQPGDFRSGYYRDQTFMMALGELTSQQFFAQLYALPDVEKEPASAGRSMNGHFGTRLLDEQGQWLTQTDRYNSSADISPTGSQMPRLLGLAYASKVYREVEALHDRTDFSKKGNEVAFGTIGNASTSEGMFFEVINAAGVLQVPMLVSVWDDEYGISVPAKYQTTKESISTILAGFQRDSNSPGVEIMVVNGWDYKTLIETYQKAAAIARKEHVPVLVHVTELTQPQGHSTSGSHERYKSKERLQWESEHDCNVKMREWMIAEGHATANECDELEALATEAAKSAKDAAWADYRHFIDTPQKTVIDLTSALNATLQNDELNNQINTLRKSKSAYLRDVMKIAKLGLYLSVGQRSTEREALADFVYQQKSENEDRYNSYMYSQSDERAAAVPVVDAMFAEDSETVDGRIVLQHCFDYWLSSDPRVFAIGEDVGKIGDVNQAFAGLQEKHGEIRVTDTGIREISIIGQGIGAALRGLRPIVEIQYLDYMLYATQILSDDLACLQYRTKGGQKAPLIIRTRGHRLEGIWHSGSPMAHLINAFHGLNVLVPRDMTQAAGFYNTILRSDEPALIVECLNGYRLKEKLPSNIGEFTVPLGQPEVLIEGTDITVVSYGSTLRIIQDALPRLNAFGITVELIDVQTLLPFDVNHHILESVKKTNRIIFIDEDMPGGTTAYMMRHVIDVQNAWEHLDAKPVCLSARENRPAYASDGDYFSKPNAEDVVEAIYHMMRESNPDRFPELY